MKLELFTSIVVATLFFMLLSEDDLPTKEESGGMFEGRSFGAVEASVVSQSVTNAIDSLKIVKIKKADSVLAEKPIVIVSHKPKSSLNTSRKPTKINDHWKDRKRKHIKMTVGQKKKLFRDLFGWLILERLVSEGVVSADVLHRDSLAIERFIDTSVHMSVLLSLPAQESGYNPFIKNVGSSARGFYQFINDTGKKMCEELGIDVKSYDPYNPYQNVTLGVHLYVRSLKKFRSVNWAIGVHHDGEGGVYDTNRVYGGIDKNPFVLAVRGAMKIKYKEPPEEAYRLWQEEIMSYNCLECVEYYSSLKDTTKIQVVDTSFVPRDTVMMPLMVKEKSLVTKEVLSRTFF